jgi:ATP-binding cassette subfamily B multidrug efflux pump
MLDGVYRWFEGRIRATAPSDGRTPPATLSGFYWHFLAEHKALFAAILGTGLAVALVDSLIPVFIGKLVSLMAATDRRAALADAWPMLVAMALVILIGRPLTVLLDLVVRNVAIVPGVTSRIRWLSHWHVVRQNWGFFQNDFAGRIATRVMQTANAVRESVVSSIRAVWFIAVYGVTSLLLMSFADPRLALPTLAWIVGYVCFLRHFVPRLRSFGKSSAEAHSALMGRVVDSYTNILTVKLFARARDEDAYVRDAIDEHRSAMGAHMRLITRFIMTLQTMNALLLASTASMGIYLWANGAIDVGMVAMALPLAWQIANMAGWVSWEVTGIFENLGHVQEGMQTIAVPHGLVDKTDAQALTVTRGEIRFEHVTFAYENRPPVFEDFSLAVRPGERVGLVGRSGAGKSTLANLLLRFFDVQGGHILIDGQSIAVVTQESLRAAIGVVTQDTSLLHRSIADNIRYGRPDAARADIEAAARKAQAHAFIVGLRDPKGREGYEAHVGERGVKLSGGQRQRVALARVLLKDAPILVLDEATSALDSEVEAAIQEQLIGLMAGKTVIAIAHRLSTIARMDRLVVIDEGKIVEQGRHDELLRNGGLYADLWTHQSGGFIANDLEPTPRGAFSGVPRAGASQTPRHPQQV